MFILTLIAIKCKNGPNISIFIARVLPFYYLLYFFILLFYNTKIYVTPYQINK